MTETAGFTDYFVICSGESSTQVRALSDHIEIMFKTGGLGPKKTRRGAGSGDGAEERPGAETVLKPQKPLSVEGSTGNQWVLLDYGDVIVHVFESSVREYYQLEKLWLDAPRIETGEWEGAESGGRSEGGA